MHKPEHDILDNMNPACVQCNLYKSCMGLEYWRKCIRENFQKYIQRNMGLRAAKRFGLLSIHDQPVEFHLFYGMVFHFEDLAYLNFCHLVTSLYYITITPAVES